MFNTIATSDLDPQSEEVESYAELYAESEAEFEVQAEKEAESEAQEVKDAESEPQAVKEVEEERVDYTRPRSERIKKRAMMESADPGSPDSPHLLVPSTKRIKDDDRPVDILALQQSLYTPLGKTYPYFPTPVPTTPKLPQAAQDWLNQVIQQDHQTGRIRYVHAPLLRPFNQNHLTVLNAAFDAYKDQLEIMRDSNFEFISVLAECSAAQVRVWFSNQAKKQQKGQRKQERIQKQQKVMQKQIRKRHMQQQDRVKKHGRPRGRPRDPEQVRQDRHRMRLENRPPGRQGPKPNAKRILPVDAPALERTKHVSRVRIPEERQVLQTFRCATIVMHKRGIPLAWTQCKGCVARQASDFCAFINFRIFEVVSEWDKDNVSKYLADHDFYSDPNPDEPMAFDLDGLTQSDAEYVLAYVGHFGKYQLSGELDTALGNESGSDSSKSSKAKKSAPNEYFRRPIPVRRLCYKCRGSFISYSHLCTSCGVELCTHCLTHDNGTMLCHEKMRHRQEQFIVCGRYHASTLRKMLERVDEAMKALPRHLHLLSDKMEIKAAQKQKPKSGAKTGSGSQGAPMPAPLRVSKDISQAEFQKHWAKGEVLVFTDLKFKNYSAWSPRELKKHTEISVTVYDAVERTFTVEAMSKLSGRGFMGRESKAIRIIEV